MAGKHYIPAVIKYTTSLAESIAAVSAAGADASVQKELLAACSKLLRQTKDALEKLISDTERVTKIADVCEMANAFHDEIVPDMNALRTPVDELELMMDKKDWPVPTYGDLMFEV